MEEKEKTEPRRCSALLGVTLLKPLKGADDNTEKCLRSWLTQDYGGPVQVLFGVATEDDPAAVVVRKLLAEFPKADAQLVVCSDAIGMNSKVSKLVQLERLARYELICVSDADVRAPVDFLGEAVCLLDLRFTNYDLREEDTGSTGNPALTKVSQKEEGNPPLTPPRRGTRQGVAVVNSFYRLANPVTVAMRCEAVAINADFWSQVLQSCSLKPMDFALGAAMVTRRAEVAAIGGFEAIKDCLADDYELGNRIVRSGGSAACTDGAGNSKRIEICPVVVECWNERMGWRDVWKHQLRWARTIRVCQPVPYFFSILSNSMVWPVVWAAIAQNRLASLFLVVALVVRMAVTSDLQRKLAGGASAANKMERTDVRCYRNGWWLAPVKDAMQVFVWMEAFLGNTIEWRGRKMKVKADGTLKEVDG